MDGSASPPGPPLSPREQFRVRTPKPFQTSHAELPLAGSAADGAAAPAAVMRSGSGALFAHAGPGPGPASLGGAPRPGVGPSPLGLVSAHAPSSTTPPASYATGAHYPPHSPPASPTRPSLFYQQQRPPSSAAVYAAPPPAFPQPQHQTPHAHLSRSATPVALPPLPHSPPPQSAMNNFAHSSATGPRERSASPSARVLLDAGSPSPSMSAAGAAAAAHSPPPASLPFAANNGSNASLNLYPSAPNDDSDGPDADNDEFQDYDKLMGGARSGSRRAGPQRMLGAFRKHWARNCVLLAVGILCVVLTAAAWLSAEEPVPSAPADASPLAPLPPPPSKPPADGRKPVSLDDIFTGTLYASKSSIAWLRGGKDGDFVQWEPGTGNLVVQHVEADGSGSSVLVDVSRVVGPDGSPIPINEDYAVSADRQYVLLSTRKEKHWRHSYTAEYLVYDVAQRRVFPLTTTGRQASVQVARWAPSGHNIAFVRDNDLYISVGWRETRLTFDGSAAVMNGVPDWVYEEEVLAANHAMYWSPTGDAVAWLRFNDSSVPIYTYPYYFDAAQRRDSPYPTHIPIRYPKPGYSNPSVSLHLYSIAAQPPSRANPVPPIRFPADLNLGNSPADMIFADVTWVGPTMLIKVMNRIQNAVKVVAIDAAVPGANRLLVDIVREHKSPDGWLEISHQLTPVPADASGTAARGYLDLVDVDGFTHLALFPTARAKAHVVLTRSDKWEVVAIKGVDTDRNVAYVLTTQQGSTLRSIAQVRLDGSDATAADGPALVDATLPPGFYAAQFSAQAKFYWVAYDGPSVPWQAVRKPTDPAFNKVLQDNAALNATAQRYALPTAQYTTIPVPAALESAAGSANANAAAPIPATVDLNAAIFYPPGFNASERYPVFMRVYGGPNSQLVQQKFDVDLHTYLSSAKRVVCVVVDGRGTGFRGRAFRNAVYRNLGDYESQDQVNAAKWLAAQPWVDASRIGIWGWSYGGYTTAKVVERNVDRDRVFAFGISVAPVTDWRFYDSVYTERYMSVPQDNAAGYRKAAVASMAGFKRTRFLLVHGTGDDNVHVQQSMALVRKLQTSQAHAYRLQVFPDSDHSMNFGNAYRELYALIDRFLSHVFFGDDEYEVALRKRGLVDVL
ncbi:Dipeptidyl peptidase 4 [Blastocladiella emersonii ATCC 22665]|nr:Dipeptidyl peptidase 4 [Blastocladiella emersonii ATCC 22665]